MSKTKIELVNSAYEYLRISGLTSKPTAEENSVALDILENMMNEFRSRNICSSYFFEENPEPNTDSEVDPSHNSAIATCLSLRLAPLFGSAVNISPELRALATTGLSSWSASTSKTNQIQPSRRQPRGSGNTFRFTNWVRYYRRGVAAPISCDTFDIKVGEIDFFGVDFSRYLLKDATITSYTVESTNGIDVLQDAQDGNIINLECKGAAYGYQTVTITVDTSTGRLNPESINFNVTDT